MLIKKVLTRGGLDVTLTENGLQLVEAFKKGKFNIIISDLNMPGARLSLCARLYFLHTRRFKTRRRPTPDPSVPLTRSHGRARGSSDNQGSYRNRKLSGHTDCGTVSQRV